MMKTTKNEFDPVERPAHYAAGRYEVIDIIEDQLGLDGLRGFCLGNTIKYVCRAGKKNPGKTVEDLKKGMWYLKHYIEKLETNTEDAAKTEKMFERLIKDVCDERDKENEQYKQMSLFDNEPPPELTKVFTDFVEAAAGFMVDNDLIGEDELEVVLNLITE